LKIEEMTSEKLSKLSGLELHSLRLRFIQLFNKWFEDNNRQKVDKLERNNFLDQYRLLLKEMNKRKRTHGVQSIDRALFRKNIYGLNTSSLGDIVKVPDYVSIGGGFVKSPKDADDLDLIVREDERKRDEGLELKLSRLMQKQIEKKCHFVYNETGAHSTYIPLFDLVLRSKNKINRVEVKEDYSKSEKIEKDLRPERTLEDYEYLLHHIEIDNKGEEKIHHCLVYDHIGNMFEQEHLLIKNGKAYLGGKEIKEGIFHVIKGLERTQEVVWSDEEAEGNKIKPKEMKSGMTLKEKAKEW